jgi:cation transport ATPase
VNYVGKEASYRLLRFALSIALALVFWGVGAFAPPMLNGVSEVGGFLTWVVLTLVGGIFLVRALFDALVLGDKTIGVFLKRLGVKEQWSRRRIFKNLAYIVALILAAAAVSPFFSDLGNVGNALQVLTTYVTLGAILLFVYDIGRTIYRIAEEKANSVADWLVQTRGKEAE